MNKIKLFFRKLIIGLFLTIALAVLVIFAAGFITFQQLKSTFAQKLDFEQSKDKNIYSVIEKDALFKPSHLKSYLGFSEVLDEKTEILMTKIVEDAKWTGLEDTFSDKVTLPSLIQNDCKDYNCFQKKIPFSMIPPNLWKALISVEDIRFLNHDGVDYKAILRALIADIKAMRIVQGGSTLTQQVIKNLFLTNEKSIVRKVKEAVYAVYLEYFYEKDQILNVYLNEVFWGNFQSVKIRGVYGASLIYFDKPPKDLNTFELAILISMLKGPNLYHPLMNRQKLFQRASYVLTKYDFNEQEKVEWDRETYDKWVESLQNKAIGNFALKNYMQMHINGDIQNSKKTKIQENEEIDLETYKKSKSNQVKSINHFEQFVLLDSFNHFVNNSKGKLSGKDYAFKIKILPIRQNSKIDYEEYEFYSKLERKKELAFNKESHQIGSLIKPLLYSFILLSGKKISEVVEADEINIKTTSGIWAPRDHGNATEESIESALQNSHNRPMLRMLQDIGFDHIERNLRQVFPNLMTPLSEYPAQLLGAIEMSFKDLGYLYKNFFKDYCKFKHIKDVVFALSDPTKTTIRRQVKHNFGETLMFGKTGTTNQGRDNWFMSFDGENLYLLWFGLESDPKKEGLPLYGSTSAFKIFQDYYLYRGRQFRDLDCTFSSDNLESDI